MTPITAPRSAINTALLDELSFSSSCTLSRLETEYEWQDPEVKQFREMLHAPIAATYDSACRWIEQGRLDGVICFNGRIDLTAAVARACADKGVPYITHERTWMGDGLLLNPNSNCLSLRAIGAMIAEYAHKPLSKEQASYAGKLLAERFLQKNSLEWRIYNKEPVRTVWPSSCTKERVLVLPSSRNEFAGHPDWATPWRANTEILDEFTDTLGISSNQVVVRCHPNWAERIGTADGVRSLEHYTEWCRKRGYLCISSSERFSTYDLIQEADVVLVNGSSSTAEAGACGKQIYSFGPSLYSNSGFVHNVESSAQLAALPNRPKLDPLEIASKTLRFIYTNARRFPQFTDYVKAIETTKYRYFSGADPTRVTEMLRTGVVEPDDDSWSEDVGAEQDVARAMLSHNWDKLVRYLPEKRIVPELDVSRRPALRWIDRARSAMPRGDL